MSLIRAPAKPVRTRTAAARMRGGAAGPGRDACGNQASLRQLRRQVPGADASGAQKDPDCPPGMPYRWGPKHGPGAADPALVAPCMATPMPAGGQKPLSAPPAQDPPAAPAPDQKPPAPAAPAPPAAPVAAPPPAAPPAAATPAAATPAPAAAPVAPSKPPAAAAPASKPPDKPEPAPNLACSYEMRQIATFGNPGGPMNLPQLAQNITTAFTGCDIAYVSIDVVPKDDSVDDDPRQHAMERAEAIKRQLMQAAGGGKFAEERFYTGFATGGPGEPEVTVWLGGRNPIGGSASGGATPDPSTAQQASPPDKRPTGQVSAQAGVGDVRHYYTTPAGPNAALHEWVQQVALAYTKQLHGKDQSGEERQVLAQVQYSLTTKQWTVSFGGQDSYVIQLPDNLQLAFWAQLMMGQNMNTQSAQASLSAGMQLTWQPKDWVQIGAQAGIGPTTQPGGPSSIDRGALFFVQIQK